MGWASGGAGEASTGAAGTLTNAAATLRCVSGDLDAGCSAAVRNWVAEFEEEAYGGNY